jgi:predicted HTH domain antitoxin
MSGVTPIVKQAVTQSVRSRLLTEVSRLPTSLLNALLWRGFEQKLEELYNQFQRGECSLGYLAEQLGITTWEAVHLLEERGWHTSNL